ERPDPDPDRLPGAVAATAPAYVPHVAAEPGDPGDLRYRPTDPAVAQRPDRQSLADPGAGLVGGDQRVALAMDQLRPARSAPPPAHQLTAIIAADREMST